jgi:hypothetical protein
MVPSHRKGRRPQVQNFLLHGREESLLLRCPQESFLTKSAKISDGAVFRWSRALTAKIDRGTATGTCPNYADVRGLWRIRFGVCTAVGYRPFEKGTLLSEGSPLQSDE